MNKKAVIGTFSVASNWKGREARTERSEVPAVRVSPGKSVAKNICAQKRKKND